MNHGLKINNNVLEITLPEEVHIDKVLVNRQVFSQRMQVCESCKYHGLEGHEEPCVSCEVGNSNYVPSVEQEERMEERTETHACDCISRQAAIEALKRKTFRLTFAEEQNCEGHVAWSAKAVYSDVMEGALLELPSAQPEQHTCVNCGRTVNNGGWYADGGTRCPIEEHYALPKDGYCHLWEKRNVTDDNYQERRKE